MKRSDLRRLAELHIRNLTTSTFTAEEDLVFISFLDEVEEILNKSNKVVEGLVQKYQIKLEDRVPVEGEGNIDKFKEAYELFMDEEMEIKNKFKFETIIKLKNENKLPASVFKIFLDSFLKK